LRRLHVTIIAGKNQFSIKYCEFGCELARCPDGRAAIAALATTTTESALIWEYM